jgi:hypothetical protein
VVGSVAGVVKRTYASALQLLYHKKHRFVSRVLREMTRSGKHLSTHLSPLFNRDDFALRMTNRSESAHAAQFHRAIPRITFRMSAAKRPSAASTRTPLTDSSSTIFVTRQSLYSSSR